MSAIQKTVDRLVYPAVAPLTSITLYYVLLFGLAAGLLWAVPDLRQAFSGERLAQILGHVHPGGGEHEQERAHALLQVGAPHVVGAQVH